MKPAGIDSDFARACFQSQQAVLPECARPRAQQSPNCNGARNHREPPVKPRCSGRGRPHSHSRVAAEVTRLKLKSEIGNESEPPHVGDCERMGARPPRALFYAPSRKTRAQGNVSLSAAESHAKMLSARARPATPVAGVLPSNRVAPVVSTAGCGGVSPPAATPDETSGEPAGEDARARYPRCPVHGRDARFQFGEAPHPGLPLDADGFMKNA